MKTPSKTFLAVLAYITVGIAWGTTYGGIRVAVESIPPFTLAGMRFLFAGVSMLLFFRLWGIPFPSRQDWVRIVPTGMLLLTCANGLLSFAEQYVESAFAALLVNTSPFVFVALSAWGGDRVPRLAWVGLSVGFGGVLVLVSPDLRGMISGGGAPRGPEFWAALVALVVGPTCWATGSFLAMRWKAGCNPLMLAAAQTTSGGAGAALVALAVGEWGRLDPASITTRSWLAVVWLVIVGSWLGYVAYMYCVLNLPPHRTASNIYVNNVVAIAVGTLFLGERLTPVMIAGGCVILLGVYLVNTAKFAKKPAAVEEQAA